MQSGTAPSTVLHEISSSTFGMRSLKMKEYKAVDGENRLKIRGLEE
jgi:hypothetical protein